MKAVVAFLVVLCYLAMGHAWRCAEGPRLYNARQVDASQGKVVGIDSSGYAYFLIGRSWYRMGGSLRFRHITTGPAGTWGASTGYAVYKYIGGSFRNARSTSMRQLDAGGYGQIVGATSSNLGYCLRNTYASAFSGSGGLSWRSLSRNLKYVSCSATRGCWGVDTAHRIYFTKNIYPSSCSTSGWSLISGSASMVEIGMDGNVFIVNRSGVLQQRTSVSTSRPQGLSWRTVSMCMKVRHVSYDLGTLWVVTTSGLLMKCTH